MIGSLDIEKIPAAWKSPGLYFLWEKIPWFDHFRRLLRALRGLADNPAGWKAGSGLGAGRKGTGAGWIGSGGFEAAMGCGEGYEEKVETRLEGRRSAILKRRSPAIENVPIMSTRINQTIKATKTGTTVDRVFWPRITDESSWWLRTAIATPHQVRMAFMAAARSQAPNIYQASVGPSRFCTGVRSLAMPAKSIPQNAMDRMVAQPRPRKRRLAPSMSVRAYSVVEKLNISKANKASRKIPPKTAPRLREMRLISDTKHSEEKFIQASIQRELRPNYRTIVLIVKLINTRL
jgi:hypothetical protein